VAFASRYAVAPTFVKLLTTHADNNVKLIVIDRLETIKKRSVCAEETRRRLFSLPIALQYSITHQDEIPNGLHGPSTPSPSFGASPRPSAGSRTSSPSSSRTSCAPSPPPTSISAAASSASQPLHNDPQIHPEGMPDAVRWNARLDGGFGEPACPYGAPWHSFLMLSARCYLTSELSISYPLPRGAVA